MKSNTSGASNAPPPVVIDGCVMCTRERATEEPLGGWVYRDSNWSVGAVSAFKVPGWLVLSLRRHAEGLGAMTDAEATSIGPILTKITSAIQAALGTQRVYMVLFGEAIPHLHILLAGIDPSAPAEHRGPGFQTYSGIYADPVAAEAAAARIRAGLGETG